MNIAKLSPVEYTHYKARPLSPSSDKQVTPRGSSHPAGIFNQPPRKVIKAKYDYTAQFAQELSFQKGDFFYVISESNRGQYEVINPLARTRGMVPVDYFTSLDKFNKDSDAGSDVSESSKVNVSSIKCISIPQSTLDLNGDVMFTVQVTFEQGHHNILFRNYNDFWKMHVALLNHFPSAAGAEDEPRIIPFLSALSKTSTKVTQDLEMILDRYLSQLWSLPSYIIRSDIFNSFLLPRSGDVESAEDLHCESDDVFLSLICEYHHPESTKIKLSFGSDMLAWKEGVSISYDEFMESVALKVGVAVDQIHYKDENGKMVRLKGDKDLSLMMRAYLFSITFYIL